MATRELQLPIVPLKGSVVFPRVPLPVTLGVPSSLRLLESLPSEASEVLVLMQRDVIGEPVHKDDLYDVGTIAELQPVRAPVQRPNLRMVIAQGSRRGRLVELSQSAPFLQGRVIELTDVMPEVVDAEFRALEQSVRTMFAEVVSASPVMSEDLVDLASSIEPASAMVDFIGSLLPSLSVSVRQQLLDAVDVRARMQLLFEELMKERENLHLQEKIRSQVHEKLAGSQREFFLREQLKAIQQELGEGDQADRDVSRLEQRIGEAKLPEEAMEEAQRELARLKEIPTVSAEYTVVRSYLDWLATLPWSKSTAEPLDLAKAGQVLDEDHYDLEQVKERILEFLAVLKLKREQKGPILCLVGPPGVGKTSVGRSIARALGRKFIRISLGGIHDEAEIRGHRRTYVGALPGQIIHGLRRVGTNDPVFMLDEVDKLGRDFHGDPSAALLEVLDPEQNNAFRDNYLDLPFDLSKVLFITTANVLDTIPPALRDRMEVVRLAGYTEEEKLHIARRYLVPRQVEAAGLRVGGDIAFSDDGLRELVRAYTREAGVRSLEREIGSLCRKQARLVATSEQPALSVTPDYVRQKLGPPPFWDEADIEQRVARPGVAVGIAWTPFGGEIIFVEAARMPRDRGELVITGQVGETMQESTRAAFSWLKANGAAYGIDPKTFRKYELHIHVPAGGVPKDGPSAGVVMVAALFSLFTDRPLRPWVALTGEVTLSGRILPVGGIKEKVLAAKRARVKEVILPASNEAHAMRDIAPALREGLTFHFVHTIDEALEAAFGVRPEAPVQPLPPAQPEPVAEIH